jgi:hypothetical protein
MEHYFFYFLVIWFFRKDRETVTQPSDSSDKKTVSVNIDFTHEKY